MMAVRQLKRVGETAVETKCCNRRFKNILRLLSPYIVKLFNENGNVLKLKSKVYLFLVFSASFLLHYKDRTYLFTVFVITRIVYQLSGKIDK